VIHVIIGTKTVTKGVSKRQRACGKPVYRHFPEVEGRLDDLLPVEGGEGWRTRH
jgi:hypothetical protein